MNEMLAAWRAELAAAAREWFGEDDAPTGRDGNLVLPSACVLRPTVRLPNAPERTLRSALKYELERLSPVSPDDVYFDFTVLLRDKTSNTAEVELRIVRRDIVDEAARRLNASGASVAAIRFEGDDKPADTSAFPIDRGAYLRDQWRRKRAAILGGAALALLLAVLLAAYLRGAEISDDLADQVADEGMRAARVEQLQQRIERATAQLAFLGKQKRSPLFVAILSDVAHTLPDGTWLTEFDLSGDKIRIEGYSRSASELIAIFDRSGRFANAQFAAPVTQGITPGVERFDLTFQLAGGVR
jgi:general secretion pathway protein L